MLRIMVVDDEKLVLEYMVSLLITAKAKVVAEFSRPKAALNWFREHSDEVDAVFLDVSMPVLDGFAVAGVIQNIRPNIPLVFVTSYDQYAVKAFEMAALDYLLKPPSLERMEKTLQRIASYKLPAAEPVEQESATDGNSNSLLSALEREELGEKKRLRSLLLKKMSGKFTDSVLLYRDGNWEWVGKAQISCFRKGKTDKYVQVLVGESVYDTVENLNDFLLNFSPEEWILCFRAVYVNVNHVDKLGKRGRYDSYLLLKGTREQVPVSRGYFDNVLLALNKSGIG